MNEKQEDKIINEEVEFYVRANQKIHNRHKKESRQVNEEESTPFQRAFSL